MLADVAPSHQSGFWIPSLSSNKKWQMVPDKCSKYHLFKTPQSAFVVLKILKKTNRT
jgi:hypothetical protein